MVMVIKAFVDRADYDNMVRNFWLKDDIDAELEVDGVKYKKGEIAFRGTTSLNYPKKGFKVKFKKKNLYQGHTKRIDLSASYTDKSLLRERLSFDLFNRTSVVSSRAWHVDFLIISKEGELLKRGLYTGLEHVDEYFFENRKRDIGTLYKADGGIVNGKFVGAVLDPQPDSILRILYDKESTKKVVAAGLAANVIKAVFSWDRIEIADADEEDYGDLDTFIRAIHSWDGATISRYLDDWMDVDSYLDWLAVNTLVQANDNYHKNYFIHNRVEDDRWEIMPWDYDFSWGRNWNDWCGGLCDDLSEGTSIKGTAPMLNHLSQRVLNNDTYFERLRAHLTQLLTDEFTEDKLFPKIDKYYAEISDVAHQDTTKWPTNPQFDQERDRLKDWIRRRRQFLFKELGTQPPPVLRPDTIVAAVGLGQGSPVAGDRLTFEATVRNIGNAGTGTTVGVAFQVDGQQVTFGTSGPLSPGASTVIKAVTPWAAAAGHHRLTAVVDDVNRFPEISEENNTLDIEFQVAAQPPPALSDVVVKDIAFERNAANQVRLAALVSNIGSAKTSDVVGVAFLVDDKFATFGVIDAMEPAATTAIRAVQTLTLTGLHKVTAIVDDINRFPEQSEQNNSRVEMIDFGTTPPRLADTVVLAVSLGAGRFTEGDELVFEAQVKNIGSAPTGDVVGVAFLVDGQYITFGNTAAMEPDEARQIRAVSAWRATAGRHQLLAVVDDVNRYPEISEENNRFELAFEVFKKDETTLPDSAVDSIDYETDSAGNVVLTATVSNIGAVPTPDVVGVAFFVDGQFVTFGTTNPMAPGATVTVRAVQPLALEGPHRVTAIVDDVDRYDEVSNQNNTLDRDLTFHPRRPVERRAVWVTRYDWTQAGKAPPPEAVDELAQNIAAAGFNTIFFQVRGQGDSYYTPGLEPWAARLTGSLWETQGQNPGWDPLARLLNKAHVAGIEVHAYVNAYTFWVSPPNSSYGQLWPPRTSPPHPFDRLTYGPGYADHPGEYALGNAWRQYDQSGTPMPLAWGQPLWASPGVDQVQNHLVAVVADLVKRYPVDGVHLDLIRYANRPYSFDPASNAAAGAEKTAQRDQWQRDRVTDAVRRIKEATQAARPNAVVSAAVWPYYKNKWGWKVSTGYDDYYQDSKGWLAAGYADAIAPMMYGSVADEFDKWQILLDDFLADSHGRAVLPGINADYDDFNAIVQRIEAARKAGAPGHAIFSYGALERRGYLEKLAAGPYAVPAVLSARHTTSS